MGPNIWLPHVAICSKTALQILVQDDILDFLESIFGEPAILAEASYQEKAGPSKGTPMHSDGNKGILVFHYLTEVGHHNGATTLYGGTHNDNKSTGVQWISDSSLKRIDQKPFSACSGSGCSLIFSQNVWHSLPAHKMGGRKVLWSMYYPKSMHSEANDMLMRQSYLTGLSQRQLTTLGIGLPAFGKEGMLRHVGSPLRPKDFVYLCRHFCTTYIRQLRNSTSSNH